MRIATDLWHRRGSSLVEELKLIKEAGFDGVEFTFSEANEALPSVSDRGYLRIEYLNDDVEVLRKASNEVGLEVHSIRSGLLWRYPLTSLDSGIRGKAISIVERELEACHRLGATALLIVPGVVNEDTPYDKAYESAKNALSALVKRAEDLGVNLAIENVCNNLLQSPLEFARFIDELASPMIGAYLDIGNVMDCRLGYPQHWIKILGGRIKRVHVKDYSIGLRGVVDLFNGDVNWPAVMKALRDVGYDGYLTAELHPFNTAYELYFRQLAERMRLLLRL
ncbi:sugar phosphate isomerase/epimerase family protein [Caldivirga maquilingensis]|uniref:Xylose isomerase domain protein TIM barrel n=1 Tax=Caldivirga maquilingensis (strain ATCC 700844 / DSM 13496 / JCM 10307 / IC-167) TaxID=397948 RepID=A8M9A1_CALMQ|nr:sugar phosphate isomerase/epimerase family protein [Caldivirga maquilingensis]ABW02320.1 Xylose isomerase domain protein TIM barrel [Caldivirga maquilingensis IC-167]